MEDQKKSADPSLFERAIFGSWDNAGLKRHKGLLEQATDNETSFFEIDKKFKIVMEKLQHHDKMLRRLFLMLGAIGSLPALNSAGVDTKELAPYIIKCVLSIGH